MAEEYPAAAIGVALVALVAVTMSLSARRSAFVSAVTHELRTPLTTLRMYAEMLAGGMVADAKSREYLDALHVESERLSHLVENSSVTRRLAFQVELQHAPRTGRIRHSHSAH